MKPKTIQPKKVDKVYTDIVNILKNNKLTVQELLLVLGNTLYTVGASIGGYGTKGPSVKELAELYATKPSLDVALMTNGLQVTTWIEDLDKTVEQIKAEHDKSK